MQLLPDWHCVQFGQQFGHTRRGIFRADMPLDPALASLRVVLIAAAIH